jgi:uncharacterized protein (TIGR03435 family)
MTAPSIAVLSLCAVCSAAFAQTAPAPSPEFEVAIIKPSRTAGGFSYSFGMRFDPAQTSMTNMSLENLILYAYNVRPFQVSGPPWIGREFYDITAKMPAAAKQEQIPAMLRTLLAQRLQLKVHRESGVLPAYALVVASGGLKIRPSTAGQQPHASAGSGYLEAQATTLADFALSLGGSADRPVVDETGVTGRFDLTLDWAVDGEHETAALPSLRVALEEKLGLKLKPCNRPIDMLIIDHVDKKPSEN